MKLVTKIFYSYIKKWV